MSVIAYRCLDAVRGRFSSGSVRVKPKPQRLGCDHVWVTRYSVAGVVCVKCGQVGELEINHSQER